jgi:cysteinyl-tRNA synthetase
MNDDFNTPKTIATLFEIVSLVNSTLADAYFGMISEETFLELKKTFNGFIEEVLGIEDLKKSNDSISDGLIDILLKLRHDAKQNKDYALSDKIRDQLVSIGVVIKDNKEKTTYTIT